MAKLLGTKARFKKKIGKCQHESCEEANPENLSIDHIVPLSNGGIDELSNWQVLCQKHNIEKGDVFGSQIEAKTNIQAHVIERKKENITEKVQHITFGLNSRGTFTIIFNLGGKEILVNVRGHEIQQLKQFINLVVK